MADYKEFFFDNAEWYSKSDSHRSGEDLGILVSNLDISPKSRVLDVATGTGFTAIAIARVAGSVFALDGTKNMLDKAKVLATGEGIRNIEFVLGDAEKIPFNEKEFDIVTCRRAAHHFKDKGLFLSEAGRVLKADGKFGLVDFVRPEGDSDDILNRIEILRDTSHVAALKASVWQKMVVERGFTISSTTILQRTILFEQWLKPIALTSKEGTSIQEFLASCDRNALLNAQFDLERMEFTKNYLVMICTKKEDNLPN